VKRADHWRSEAELRQYLASRSLFGRWQQEMIELYIRYGMQKSDDGRYELICSPQREAALFMGGMKQNPWPLLPKIGCPVLVLEAEESDNRIYAELEKASAAMPHGSYRLVREAGHLIPMEKPDEISRTIIAFFDARGV
jgi:lipase